MLLEGPRTQPSVPDDLDVDAEDTLSKTPQLWDVGEDGDLSFKSDDPNASLAARLQRIWAERGDFSKVTQASIDRPASPVDEDEANAEGEALTSEELWKLKTDMLGRLETARGELSTALDLLNLVLPEVVQSKPSDAPPPEVPLPHGTLTSLVLDLPLSRRPVPAQAQAASTSYASKQTSLKSIGDRLIAAAGRLAETASANEKIWSTWIDWAHGGRVEARGARKGAGTIDAKALERTAKEIVTFFGCEEAAEAYRRASYAHLDADGGTSVPPRSRGRRRVVVRLKLSANGEELFYCPSMREEEVFAAHRREVFDEELFTEMAKEAKDLPASIVDNVITLSLPEEGRLTISLESECESNSAPLPALIASYLRLRLIALYRRRHTAPHPYQLAAISTKSPSLLSPTLDFLTLYLRSLKLLDLFRRTAAALPAAAVTRALDRFDLTAEPPQYGGVVSLRFGGRSVHARLSSTETAIALDLDDGRRVLPSTMAQLETILAEEARTMKSQSR